MKRSYDITEYIDTLYAAALRKTGDSYAAEELVQETCLAALQALAKGKEPENLQAWLLAILSNKHCDRLRKRYNEPLVSFDSFPIELPDEMPEDDDTADKLETIRRELGYLGYIHREVMVRYYIRGESVDAIAKDLQLPVGTVKSRLHTGRTHVKKGVSTMENYMNQSFAPDILRVGCSGGSGRNNEPFSLVGYTDTLTQNLLLSAYEKPVTVTELAKALGVPAAFIEPILERLVNGELMQRTDGGKVYTDFIIYTDKNRKATFQKQLGLVDKHFELFWKELAPALDALREQPYYQRQPADAQAMLTLHFCLRVLINAHIAVRNEITGEMPYSDYPYRKNGGRWLAIGDHYPHGYREEDDAGYRKYAFDGEASMYVENYRDTAKVGLHKYGTSLGDYPNCYFDAEYIQWLYEVYAGVNEERSGVSGHIPEAASTFVQTGILKRDPALKLAVPVIGRAEYLAECALADEYSKAVTRAVRDILITVFEEGCVKLPAHLKSVPKWQQYMLCGDSIPMAVIHKAIENGLLFNGIDHKLPAALLVIEKA